MANQNFVCANGRCRRQGYQHAANPNPGMLVFGKVGGLAAGAALGGGVSKHPVGAALGAAVGLAFGHLIDELVTPKCPACGVALQVLATVV